MILLRHARVSIVISAILNVDVTAYKNGWHGDTSRMFKIGEVSIKAEKSILSIILTEPYPPLAEIIALIE